MTSTISAHRIGGLFFSQIDRTGAGFALRWLERGPFWPQQGVDIMVRQDGDERGVKLT